MPSLNPPRDPQLVPTGPEIWECDYPHRAAGMALGRRLTVVRLPTGGLWVHASLPPTNDLLAQLAGLGQVRYIIGPNTFHDAYLPEFVAAFPEAQFLAAPGLAVSNRRLKPNGILGGATPAEWAGSLDAHLVQGMPKLNEVVFLHRPSRSLVLADLAFNLRPPKPWFTRLMMSLNGAYGRFTPSRFFRSMIADRAALQRSLQTIQAWDFTRIVVGHGEPVDAHAKEVFRRAFAFVL